MTVILMCPAIGNPPQLAAGHATVLTLLPFPPPPLRPLPYSSSSNRDGEENPKHCQHSGNPDTASHARRLARVGCNPPRPVHSNSHFCFRRGADERQLCNGFGAPPASGVLR